MHCRQTDLYDESLLIALNIVHDRLSFPKQHVISQTKFQMKLVHQTRIWNHISQSLLEIKPMLMNVNKRFFVAKPMSKDSMGKDVTQLLWRCVRLLVLWRTKFRFLHLGYIFTIYVGYFVNFTSEIFDIVKFIIL